MATIPFDEIVLGATARLCVMDDVQYLSITDVIKHVCAKDFRGASKVWRNLSDEKKEEVWQKRTHFQFPGQGQSEQPVTTFQGILKLVMIVGGENAKKYRTSMVKILTRYYAGDGSLTEEIEANAKSAAPITQMARASLAAEQVEDRSLVDLKRKREELEFSKMHEEVESMRKANRAAELANRAMEHEHLSKVTASYRELCQDTVMDERSRMIFKDNFLNMAMLQGPAAAGLLTDGQPNNNKPISLSLVAAAMGLKIPSNDLISIGVELKKRYVEKHGKDPSKHDQLCNGRMTKVNSYMESDRPLVEEVLRWHTAGRV
jgi:hypothetical protein